MLAPLPFVGVGDAAVAQLQSDLVLTLLQFGGAGAGQVVHVGLLGRGIGGVGDGQSVVDGCGGVGVVQHGGGYEDLPGRFLIWGRG